MLFIHNKYYKTYYTIIDRAKSRKTVKKYTEQHHIIPKSLGGPNSKDNKAVLTMREHIICHKLLPKFTTGSDKKKMCLALWFITRSHKDRPDIKLSTRQAAKIREDMVNVQKSLPKPKGRIPWNKGKKIWSAKQKREIGQRNRDNGPQSAATIEKRAVKNRGQKRSPEQCQKIGNARRGSKHSAETKQLMSIVRKEKPSPKKGIKTGLTGDKSVTSKSWNILYKNGKEESITGLREWCSTNNLNYKSVWKAAMDNRWFKNNYYITKII